MTIDISEEQRNVFTKTVKRIAPSVTVENAYRINLPEAVASRNEKYAKAVMPLLENCESLHLMECFEDKNKRNKVLCHVADIVYRQQQKWGTEANLTIDDAICIAVAVQLHADQKGKKKMLLGTLIPPLSEEEVLALGSRIVSYQLSNQPEGYEDDNKTKVSKILMQQLYSEKTDKQLATELSILPSVITTRVDAYRKQDRFCLALFHPGANVESSILVGPGAYDMNFGVIWGSDQRSFRPIPIE